MTACLQSETPRRTGRFMLRGRVEKTVARSGKSLPRGEVIGKRSPKGGSVTSGGRDSLASSHRLAWAPWPHAGPGATP